MKKKQTISADYDSGFAYKVSAADVHEVFSILDSNPTGLDSSQVRDRLLKYGHNEITEKKKNIILHLLRKAVLTPFNEILFALAIVSLVIDVVLNKSQTRDWSTVIVITVMVLLSTCLRFIREYNSEKASKALRNMVRNTAAVFRNNSDVDKEIDMMNLVPGDVIHLSAGDMIPADVRVFESKDIFVSQSSLTGESDMIEKFPSLMAGNKNQSITELCDICFMGTTVVSGSARAVVFATGHSTYLGTIAKSLESERELTDFDIGINNVSKLLIRFMLIMAPVVFIINGLTKDNWLEALLFSLSVAVGLTPEMLPMIVTGNLAKGAIAMSRKKTIVKNIDSIQNFGAMNILCTDKTGTLTLDRITLERYLDIEGNESVRVLIKAYYNSFFQTGLKDLMDKAILAHKSDLGFENLHESYSKIDEIPFDFVRRRMSVVIEDNGKTITMLTKGAPEEILNICTSFDHDNVVNTLDDERLNGIRTMLADLNENGMRVLGVCYKQMNDKVAGFTTEDESGMTLIGFLAFLDPPKKSAGKAIDELHKNGVNVKVLSGDTLGVVKSVCGKLGVNTGNFLTGEMIAEMDDDTLRQRLCDTDVYAKLTPMQKSRIIAGLQAMGNTVGYLGDGINDASALKQSDIGISVDTAVDIARESADIILLEKNLLVLKEGVIEGRRIFGNISKYIKMAASSNFGNMFSVLIASVFLPFLPMLPIQILVQNLLYDFSQTSIPFDSVDKEFLSKPRKWDSSDLKWFMIDIGPISSIFDICTFLLMWHVFGCSSPEHQSLFQSGWFVEGLLSQTLIVHMIRTKQIPFIQSTASPHVLITTCMVMISGIVIPFTSFGRTIGLHALPLSYFWWLIAMLAGYCVLTQIAKTLYIRHFNRWLS